MSAPSINSEIRDQGIIEGGGQGFKAKEVEHLIKILQGGSLPASLNPTPLQEEKVGPTLGEDTIAKGVCAIWVSMLVVPIFMLVYYRFAGVVAVVALVLNMILLIGSMAFMQSTFSLPGLAGLALTIGMAVDANVLVFERMREEKERGAGLAQQIRNGFNRAWVTIFDSHVTLLLSARRPLRGRHRGGQGLRPDDDHRHALEPVHRRLRLAGDLRVLLPEGLAQEADDAEDDRQAELRLHRPAPLLHGRLARSLIVLGLVAFFARGQSMYNIDFTGGTLVTIRLNEDDPRGQASSPSRSGPASSAQKAGDLPDVTVESLKVGKDKTLTRFNIRTTEQKPEQVKETILKAFGPTLERVEMTVGDPQADRRRAAPSRPATAAAAAPAPVDRFAGGRKYDLKFNTTAFNSTQSPAQVVAAEFAKVLEAAKIANPTSRFEIVGPPPRREAAPADGATTLDPADRPRARRRQGAARRRWRPRWRTTATCSSSGSPTSAARSPARPGPSP